MAELGWMDSAVCLQAPAEMFHPASNESPNPAKRLCRACPVIAQCLTWSLSMPESSGVLGGLTERERRRLRRSAA